MVRVNYDKEHYCHQCSIKVALELFRCPDCNQKVRTKRHNKQKPYSERRKYFNPGPRAEDFRVKMRKLRIQRMMEGLKPNIPVPEVE